MYTMVFAVIIHIIRNIIYIIIQSYMYVFVYEFVPGIYPIIATINLIFLFNFFSSSLYSSLSHLWFHNVIVSWNRITVFIFF